MDIKRQRSGLPAQGLGSVNNVADPEVRLLLQQIQAEIQRLSREVQPTAPDQGPVQRVTFLTRPEWDNGSRKMRIFGRDLLFREGKFETTTSEKMTTEFIIDGGGEAAEIPEPPEPIVVNAPIYQIVVNSGT